MKHSQFKKPVFTMAVTISILAGACPVQAAAPKTSQIKTSAQKTLAPKSTTKPSGVSAVSLSKEEKEMAAKLGFDEAVLALIKDCLSAELGIVSASTDEANSANEGKPHVFRGDEYPTAPLLQKDVENYKKIARDYPELAKLANETIDFREADKANKAKTFEDIIADKDNKDTLRRQKKYFDFMRQNEASVTQYLDDLRKQKKMTGNSFVTISSPDFSSDAAVDKKIAEIQGMLKNLVLRDEYKPKSILGLRYKCDNGGKYGPDKRVDKLQAQLDSLGYKISPILRSPSVAQTFETKEEAIAFLASYGIKQFDGLTLREQSAQKYEGIYPVDFSKDLENQEDLRTLVLQSTTYLDKSDTESLDKLGANLKSIKSNPQLSTEGKNPEMRLEPGTTIKKIGDRRWQLDRPARYEATAVIKIATVMKMPKDDFGIELVRSQGTNGLNYSVDNDMVIEKLKKWNNQYGISVLEAGHDSMTVKFKNLPDDLSELVTEYFLFDPEMEVSGTEQHAAAVMRETARKLRQTHTLSFWWD